MEKLEKVYYIECNSRCAYGDIESRVDNIYVNREKAIARLKELAQSSKEDYESRFPDDYDIENETDILFQIQHDYWYDFNEFILHETNLVY